MARESGLTYFTGLFRAALPTILTFGALLIWGFLSWQVYVNAPRGNVGRAIEITRSATPYAVGYAELGQTPGPRSAAAQHLLVRNDGGRWVFANASGNRKVLLSTSETSGRFIQRWGIRVGDRISFDGADITVVAVSNDSITLREKFSGRQMTWDGDMNAAGEKVHDVCEGTLRSIINDLKWASRSVFAGDKAELPVFSIGGGVNCPNRWKMPRLDPVAVVIVWQGGRFWVAPGSARRETLLFRGGQQTGTTFDQLKVEMDGRFGKVQSVILGITRYNITDKGDRLRLSPVSNKQYFLASGAPPRYPQSMRWLGAGKGPLPWITGMAPMIAVGIFVATALGIGAFWFWRKRYRHDNWWLVHAIAALIPAVGGIWVTLLLMRSWGQPDQSLIVAMAWIAWFWATFLLVWSGRLTGYGGWTWLCGTILAGIGTTALFQLGAGADNSRWLGFYYKHAAIIALFAWLIALFTLVPNRAWRNLWIRIFNRESVLAVAAILLIIAMIAQFIVGSEEGIAGLQPVELVKTIFVILLGYVGLHVTETRTRDARAFRESPLTYLAPYFRMAGVFFLVIASIVVGVRDFSPLVIMTVVLLAWTWKVGGTMGGLSSGGKLFVWIRPAIALFALGIISLMVYIYANPEVVPDGFPQKDRILVWAKPQLFPHSGSQVLGSMDFVGQGGWFGARPWQWFGANGPIMTLPAVQDDFITAFLINRFGAAAGLIMLGVQLIYILLLFGMGRRLERVLGRGDYRDQNAGIVLGYTLYGLAWLHMAHWLISWGNTLGLLPVMGQPMTWLTAGNSHLMGFALLILLIAQISAWAGLSFSDEEKGRQR